MRLILLAAALVLSPLKVAAADWSVAALGGVFARYPGSLSDTGGALAGSRSLWLGAAHRFVQLRADASLLAGIGTSPTAYVAAGVTGGADLYLFDWLSLDVRIGPAAGLQAGGAGVTPAVGLWGGGGWSLHPWADRQKRLTLALAMTPLVALRADPGNDAPMGGSFLFGLGYEGTL